MLVGLKDDGTYDVMKMGSDIYSKRSKYKYCIFDCSSYNKGPIHTIVKSKDIHELPEVLKIEITLNFTNPEVGRDFIHGLKMEYDVDSLCTLYSIISNIYQYELYNIYISEIAYDLDLNEEIIIEDIRLFYKQKNDKYEITFHYYYDAPCDLLDQFLKSVGMNLSTNKAFGNKEYLILDSNGTWYFDNKVPDSAKYVGVHLQYANSFYLVSYKSFCRMNLIKSIDVSIGRKNDNIFNERYNQIFSFYEYNMSYTSLLIIPQYVLLYRQLIDKDIVAYISIIFDNDEEYSITAESKEIDEYGISLFKIIDNLTKI